MATVRRLLPALAVLALLFAARPAVAATPVFSMSGSPTAPPNAGVLTGGRVGMFRTSVAQWFEVRWDVRSYIERQHCYGIVVVTDTTGDDEGIYGDLNRCPGALSVRSDLFLHPGLHKVKVYSYVGWTVTVTREPEPQPVETHP